jgi:hypothetical protein
LAEHQRIDSSHRLENREMRRISSFVPALALTSTLALASTANAGAPSTAHRLPLAGRDPVGAEPREPMGPPLSDRTEIPVRSTERRSPRWPIWGALATVAFAFLAVSSLAGVPARVIEGCAKWIGLAGALELLSVLGFVVVFKLVFGARMT